MILKQRLAIGLGGAAIGLAGVVGGLWHRQYREHSPDRKMVYVSSGYGGLTPAPSPTAAPAKTHAAPRTIDPVQSLNEEYNAGNYQNLESAAVRLVAQAHKSSSPKLHKEAAEASALLAYSAARRHDMKLAQTRFAAARVEAARLPDKGKQTIASGVQSPTLEEDAAYQHAVCTGALGDKAAAEAEYLAFMKQYPESPLVQASIKRIARLHNGDIPPAAQSLWHEAGMIAATRQKARQREASLCGPECLAELLRRRGDDGDVHAIAVSMRTTDQGSTLEAFAEAAQKKGYKATGLSLTMAGLVKQKLPLIALINPGHFVIVDVVSPAQITVWDPDLHGIGHGGAHTYTNSEWARVWRGTTLTLDSVAPSSQV